MMIHMYIQCHPPYAPIFCIGDVDFASSTEILDDIELGWRYKSDQVHDIEVDEIRKIAA